MRLKRAGVILSLAVLLALAGICVSLTSSSGEQEAEILPPIHLNEVIDNDTTAFPALRGMDAAIENYMAYWRLRGVSLSIMRNDSLLFCKGYGWADKEAGVEMSPAYIMRVASVSKLLTATAIMKLQEAGRLHLKDTVFGPSGILRDTAYTSVMKDPLYNLITVEDLLRHKGGFTASGGDPMFSTRTIMLQNHLDTPPGNIELMRIYLRRRLRFRPGTSQYYSNFGYLLLSKIIEQVSGLDYETYMRDSVLVPAGCYDMHIAHNYYEERYPGEVKYYNGADTLLVEEYNNSGRMVERCYGGSDVRALSGAGAWVTSTPELARFVASIDGRPGVPDIISGESVDAMTEWFDPETYSLGWNDTKPTGEWTRTGTLSGTSALIKYYPDGECWIMVTNTSTWKGPGFTSYTAGLFKKLREKYSSKLPSRDLFHTEHN
ncbi:MAG: serine hydrolase domain-containing protein [Candidatus Cryptobacteroides sp.]